MHSSLKTVPITQAGYQALIDERDSLQSRRPQAVAELSRARDEGDRSENAAYKAARWEVSSIDKRLRYLNKLIITAKVLTASEADTVQVGTTVHLSGGNKTFQYQIVGIHESNPIQGKLSHASPVGAALINHRVGDTVNVHTPQGAATFTITEIHLS